MIIKKIKNNKGFVLLFTTILSGIILAVTLGVANIALKELRFSTGGKDTNEAFFAADTGAECALYYDKSSINRFASPDPTGTITCANTTITPIFSGDTTTWSYSFIMSGLGNSSLGCAKITIDKTNTPTTKITSKGYNDGGSVAGVCTQGANSVERQLELSY